jgi:hypothetical protein
MSGAIERQAGGTVPAIHRDKKRRGANPCAVSGQDARAA